MTNMSPSQGGTPRPEIRIARYQDWMAPQVIALLAHQWKRPVDHEESLFHQFFDHPFQQNSAVRLAALDGDSVCGFQSYAYWPYMWEDQGLHTLQSGHSVVSPGYRGQGVFARLLCFPWHVDHTAEVPFLTGFPIESSYGSLIRNQWINPFNLSWHVRVLRPFSVLRSTQPARLPSSFDIEPMELTASQAPGMLSLSRHPDFTAWRTACSPHHYWYFHFQDHGRIVRYQLKPNRRGRVSEMIIGDIARESLDPCLLAASLKALIRAVNRGPSFTILSIAINDRCSDASLRTSLAACGFHSIRRHIFFTVKPLSHKVPVADAVNWWLLRSDIDTW
jgi:hypothetical protein